MPTKKISNKQLTEIGKEIVKKETRGRPKGSGGNKRPDSTAQTEPGDNTKYITHSLRLSHLPTTDLSNTEQVAQRINQYFAICAEDDMKPSVAGLALALDTDRKYLWELREGKRGKNKDVEDLLKKAMKILDLQMVDYMQNGKINPVSGIFLMKNNFGYADKQEVIVTPNNPLGDTKDTKELQEAYIEGSIVDETEN